MSIQFLCTSCQQPIEVDDEHAGKSAACPYCRNLVSVPHESTYSPVEAVTARPAGRPYGAAGLPTDPDIFVRSLPPLDPMQAAQRAAASSFGTYALLCAALVAVLFAVATVRLINVMARAGLLPQADRPSGLDVEKINELVAGDPWIIGPAFGAMFFALAGLGLSIASLTRFARGNWKAITACVLCGLYMLCNCGGALFGPALGG